MAALPRAASLLAVVPLLFACERPATSPSAVVAADLVHAASGLVLHEAGYEARVIADGLIQPQGTVEFGNGLMFVTSSGTREIVRVLPSGAHKTFAAFPAPGSLVDLIFDPGRGLFASTILAPIGLAAPVWRVGMNGDTTRFAAVAGGQTFLALDDAGRLYVTQAVGDVVRVELDGSITAVVDANPAITGRLRGITFDEQGRLYVLSAGESPSKTRIRRFDLAAATLLPIPLADGDLITDVLPAPPTASPLQDLLFWPQGGGDLFTVDASNVYRVKLDGTVSVFASGLTSEPAPVFNTLALSGAGDLLVTEYALGRVIRISR